MAIHMLCVWFIATSIWALGSAGCSSQQRSRPPWNGSSPELGTIAPAFLQQERCLHSYQDGSVPDVDFVALVVLNAHIWSPCPPAQIQKWQNAIRKPLGLLAKGHTSGVSPLLLDAPVLCGILRILPPEDLLRMARLRYLKRLFAVCPMVLWQLLMVIAGVRCR